MADLPNQTSNVSVWDDLGGNAVGVTSNISTGLYEFHVVDDDGNDWLEQIATGTTVISGNVTTSWEAFSNDGRAYITTFGANFTGGTAETGFILLRNPVSSGRYLKIYRLTLAVTTNTTGKFRVYRHPTITTPGTALYVEEFGLS